MQQMHTKKLRLVQKKPKKLKLKGMIWNVEKDYLYLRCAKLEVVLSRQKTCFQLVDRLNDLSVLLFPCCFYCFWHNGIFHRPSWNEKFLVNGQVLSLPHLGWACVNVPTKKTLKNLPKIHWSNQGPNPPKPGRNWLGGWSILHQPGFPR